MNVKRLSEPSHYFKCNYCSQEFTLESFRVAVILYGIIFLVSKHYGYVGIVCPNCLKTTVDKNERQQIIKVKKELGESIGFVFFVENNEVYNKKILTSNELKEAVENHDQEILSSFLSKLRYSTFGQSPYDKNIQQYNTLKQRKVFGSSIIQPYKGSNYAMTMTQDEIDLLAPNDNIFISYIANSKILEDSVFFFGLEEKNINDLVSLENDSRKKVFPRYFYANSTLKFCEKFYYDQPKEIVKYLERIKNPVKRSLQKHMDLLTILEIVSKDDRYAQLIESNIYQVVWRTEHPFEGKGVPKTISELNLERFLTKRKKLQDQNDKFITEIWSKFMENNTQNVLSKKSFYFAVEIIELAKRIDFSNSLIFDLQNKYLKDIYDAIVSPHKTIKPRKIVHKVFNEAKKEIGIEIISQDYRIMEIVTLILPYVERKAGRKDNINILILGETGTGKEIIAEAYQKATRKLGRKGKFIIRNVTEFSENLIESALFGHAKGAFSGANKERKGAFLSANNGVIFLDEIGDLSLAAQAKILRVIENRKITALGKDITEKIDVVIIMATNKDLPQLVKEGKFREDLYYRIADGYEHIIPPLRERKDDIPLLLNYFIDEFDNDRKNNKKLPKFKFSTECIKYLKSLHWPGNVRQLKNMVRIVVDIRLIEENRSEINEIEISKYIQVVSSTKTESSKKQKHGEKLTPEILKQALINNDGNITDAARELCYTREHLSRSKTKWGL